MTTLYFEASDEDDLRKTGFSKDGKHQNPQIFIGLLVGLGGYAIGYDIFEGNTYEGHTLIPFLEKISRKFNLDKLVIVADAGLLSNENRCNYHILHCVPWLEFLAIELFNFR
jgi:transposase